MENLLGIYEKALPLEVTWQERFKIAKDLGFDFVEISIDEKDFRYSGPKPQTKEAGIVMLADAVEAASRTLSDPTSSRIKGHVRRIINNIFADGQLDDCELTLKDLHYIEESFGRILTGIFHQRIEYPESQEEQNTSKKDGNEGTHSKSTRPHKNKQKDNHKVGPHHLRRVEPPG